MQPRRHRNERKRILVVLDTGTHMRGLLMLMEEGIAYAPFVSNKYHCTGRQVRVLQQAQWQGATVLRGEAGRVFDAAWYRLDFLPSTPSGSPSCSEPFQSPKAVFFQCSLTLDHSYVWGFGCNCASSVMNSARALWKSVEAGAQVSSSGILLLYPVRIGLFVTRHACIGRLGSACLLQRVQLDALSLCPRVRQGSYLSSHLL